MTHTEQPSQWWRRRPCRRSFAAIWALAAALAILSPADGTRAAAGAVSLTAFGTRYVQDFDTLAATGSSSTLPVGWALSETLANADASYTAGAGAGNAGDTYSFGADGSQDRAFGGLQSGSLIPRIGAAFSNDTGGTITSLDIAYAGEQWRLGTAGRADLITFQYSLDAASLTSGTWIDVSALDFASPQTTGAVGALNGNSVTTPVRGTIASLTISSGGTFWIRWNDFNATGADDGLAVDTFALTPQGTGGGASPTGTGAATPSTVGSGDSTLLTVKVTPGTTNDVAVTADLSSIGRSPSQPLYDEGTNGDATAADLLFSFRLTIASGTAAGARALPVRIVDAAGRSGVTSIALTVLAPSLTIAQIQGSSAASIYAGTSIATSGIVTAIKLAGGGTVSGFFLQMPDPGDGDPATSDGIFVFTTSLPAGVSVGRIVTLAGTVQEFVPAADPGSLPLTQIAGPSSVVVGALQSLPSAVTITTADTNPAGSFDQLERLEGMRVFVASLTTVSGTTGFRSTALEAAASSDPDGAFYGVLTGIGRPFREPGVQRPDALPAGAPCCVPRFDTNPERLRIDSDAQPGLLDADINVNTGAVIQNLEGVLDYGFRTYTILVDPVSPHRVSGGVTATAVRAPAADEFTVATFNMERFFDTVDDPTISDVALSPAAFALRLRKASDLIRNWLRTPDIIAVQEVENLSALRAIASEVTVDALAARAPDPLYVAYLVEGNDIGGIDVGFLIKTGAGRSSNVSVTQLGKDTTFVDPVDSSVDILNDRPPLILTAWIHAPSGKVFPITVINNHLRSLTDIEDSGATGARVRAKRRAQAEFLATLIATRQSGNPGERILSVGDYNAFQFNDGYVDVIGTIKGTPTPPDQVILPSADLINPDLVDLVDAVPADRRYSYVFGGSAQELDHVLVTSSLLPLTRGIDYARVNADFSEIYRPLTRPERLSDHDPIVVYIALPTRP